MTKTIEELTEDYIHLRDVSRGKYDEFMAAREKWQDSAKAASAAFHALNQAAIEHNKILEEKS